MGEIPDGSPDVSRAVGTQGNPKFGRWKGNYRGNTEGAGTKELNQDGLGKRSEGSRFGVLRENSKMENDSVEISNAAATVDNHKMIIAIPLINSQDVRSKLQIHASGSL